MLKKAKMVLTAALVATIASCGDGGENNPAAPSAHEAPAGKIAALESSGKIPTLERGTDIGGTDRNANGVRDDIESLLTSEYTGAQLAAAMQTARALQKSLLVDTGDIHAVKAVDRELSRAINCIYSKFDGADGSKQPARVAQELESMTANTKTRLSAYLRYNKALDGTSSALPEGDTCE